MTEEPQRRVEVYSARRLAAPGYPYGVRCGYARCLDCDWWIATLDVTGAAQAAQEHERCEHQP